MPDEVWKGSDAEKDGWILGQAAVWPDLVKRKSDVVTADDVTRFNRPVRHYVDFPIYLNDTERQRLEKSIRENIETNPPKSEIDDRSMNIVQAIKNSGRVVKSSKNDLERAVHLCWLFHLVGDSHQPLHFSALFTSARFPKGDEGGNGIMVRGKLKLHAYWDNAISRDRKYNGVRRKAFDLLNNQGLGAVGKEAIKSLQPEDWIQEGHEIAKRDVYTDHIRKMVPDAEGRENLGDMNTPREYDRSSAQIGEKRAVEAGYRLAALLERLFFPQ
jgi:hypothetical protein